MFVKVGVKGKREVTYVRKFISSEEVEEVTMGKNALKLFLYYMYFLYVVITKMFPSYLFINLCLKVLCTYTFE